MTSDSPQLDSARRDLVLLVAMVQQQDAGRFIGELTKRGHWATRLDAVGGFLQDSNVVVLVGTEVGRESEVLDVIAQTCQTRKAWVPAMPVGDPASGVGVPIEVEVGGAIVFVLPVERRVQLSGLWQRELTAAV